MDCSLPSYFILTPWGTYSGGKYTPLCLREVHLTDSSSFSFWFNHHASASSSSSSSFLTFLTLDLSSASSFLTFLILDLSSTSSLPRFLMVVVLGFDLLDETGSVLTLVLVGVD